MLISQSTQDKLNALMMKGFALNRHWDNYLGFSSVAWSWSTFGKNYHSQLSHLYPLLSDQISDILLRYNETPQYGTTEKDTRTFSGMVEMFEDNLQHHVEMYNLIKDTMEEASINGDTNVKEDLAKFMRMFNHFMEQAILLRDKSESYGEQNKFLFDAFCPQFYVLQKEYKTLTGNKYKAG